MRRTQLNLKSLGRCVGLAVALAACGSTHPTFTNTDAGPTNDMGTAMGCASGQTYCGGACVDTSTNPANCGQCGTSCGAGLLCVNGLCSAQCPGTEVTCGDVCASLETDRMHCGSCGNACAQGQVCSAGVCTVVCGPTYVSCEAPQDSGASGGPDRWCIDPLTDERNCGGCGNACPQGNLCVAGTCTPMCPPVQTLCGGQCVSVQTDPQNCGGCGTACPAGQGCVGGTCTGGACGTGTTLCGSACVDTTMDIAHCGACGHACPADNYCAMGTCTITCIPSLTVCAGSCVNLQADRTNCGACAHACDPGYICHAGSCALACAVGAMVCSGHCVDPTTDGANCGACGTVCAAGQICTGGACAPACAATQTTCTGVCVDTQVDPANCGGCGIACGPGYACGGGYCRPLVGTDASGCAPPSVMCGAVCADTRSDNLHCGTCGRACSASTTCIASMCLAPCAAGQTRCGLGCVDATTDVANCGTCGHVCAAGLYCVAGSCVMAAPTRYREVLPAPSTVTFVDACAAAGHTSVLAGVDDGSVVATLPFAFRYWATDLPSGAPINVCSNGWIGMTGAMDVTASGMIPDPTGGGFDPVGVVAPNWQDEVNRGAQCIATVGAAPNRQWVVEWDDAAHFPVSSAVHETYEVILTEGTGTIDFVYQTMTGADMATVGVMSQDDTQGVGGCVGAATTCTMGVGAVRFSPIP